MEPIVFTARVHGIEAAEPRWLGAPRHAVVTIALMDSVGRGSELCYECPIAEIPAFGTSLEVVLRERET